MTLCPGVLSKLQNPFSDVSVINSMENFEDFDHVSLVAPVLHHWQIQLDQSLLVIQMAE